jgi:hypothetical protein
MKHKIYFFVLTAILLFSASSAESFQFTFTPRLTVAEEFTDNVFLSPENTETDFITTITPGFVLGLPGKMAGMELSYNPSYAYYNEFDENNTWRHQADLSGWTQLTKDTRIDLRDSFVNTEDPLSEADIAVIRTEDPALPVDTGIRRGRNRYSRNFAEANFTHQFGPSDDFRIGYSHTLLENDDPAIEDSQTHNPSAALRYWFLPQWGVDLSGAYTKGEYEIRDDVEKWHGSLKLLKKFSPHLDGYLRYSHTQYRYEGETGDDKTYNPSVGIDYEIAEDLTLNFDVGYFINAYEKREDQDGLTLDARLIKRFRRGSINLIARSGYDQAIGQTENLGYEKFAEGGASATYRFTRYVSGNINGFYRYSDYVDNLNARRDDSVRGSAGLAVAPLSWMTIDLRYSFRMLESTLDANEYQENRALLSITLAPATPYRTSNY